MEGQIAPTAKPRHVKAPHLMCGTPLWGVVGLVTCAYLAYISYAHVRHQGFNWKHDVWSGVTYAVWVLLLAGLNSETRCWRERVFFGLVLANFALGFALTVWGGAPREAVRDVRVVSGALWVLAALASTVVVFSGGKEPPSA
jgi:hypothetical protein